MKRVSGGEGFRRSDIEAKEGDDYSTEPMMANDGAGARHLGDNEAVAHYAAGPAERMENWLVQYVREAKTRTPKGLQTWLAEVSKAKNSKLGQIFNHVESREYLKVLMDFSPHFMVDSIFSMTFCTSYMHDVSGGVSPQLLLRARN
jgi:Maltooligosyl trehalose synthase